MAFPLVNLIGFGFLLGFAHAFEADHMVVVGALVSESVSGGKSIAHSSLLGALWGLGHTTTLFVMGGVLLALRLVIPAPLTLFFEFLVGAMLVILGVGVVGRAFRSPSHQHGERAHAHSHHHRRSFVVGMMHGLAGTSALMLLAVASVSSFVGGLFFIAIFGIGSIMGMFVMSTALGLPFRVLSSRFASAERFIPVLAGILSIAFGLWITANLLAGL